MPDARQWLLILSMAAVLYLLRIAGLLIANRLPDSPRVTRLLEVLPGITMVAIVLPSVAASGAVGILASALVWLVVVKTGNLGLAIILGVGLVTIVA